MHFDEGLAVVAVEVSDNVYIASVVTGPLGSDEGFQTVAVAQVAQRTLQLTRRQVAPTLRQFFIQVGLLTDREMGEQRIAESERREDRVHLHRLGGYTECHSRTL